MIEYMAKVNHSPVSTTEPISAMGRFRRGLRVSSATVVDDSKPKNASTMNTNASPSPPNPVGEWLGRNDVGTCPWSPPLKMMSSSRIPATATSAITNARSKRIEVCTEYQASAPTATTMKIIRIHQAMWIPKSVASAWLTKPPNRLVFSGLCSV